MRLKFLILTFLIYGLWTMDYGLIYADTIIKKDNAELKGIVVEDYKDRLVFSTADGEIMVIKTDIRELYYDSEEDNLIKLAEQARDRRDYQKAYAYYEIASKINPDSKTARDGKVFLQGYLFRQEQARKEEDVKRQEDFERYGTIIETEKAAEEKLNELKEKLKKRLGMTLKPEADRTLIESVRANSSAYEGGARESDLLVAIWGRLTGYMQLQEVMDILLDKPSLEIKCTVERPVVIDKDKNAQIGASFSMEFDGLTVSSVREGAPALAAGVKKGDLIVAIDGKSTRYTPLKKALELIRDSKKDSVKFTLRREIIIWRRD